MEFLLLARHTAVSRNLSALQTWFLSTIISFITARAATYATMPSPLMNPITLLFLVRMAIPLAKVVFHTITNSFSMMPVFNHPLTIQTRTLLGFGQPEVLVDTLGFPIDAL